MSLLRICPFCELFLRCGTLQNPTPITKIEVSVYVIDNTQARQHARRRYRVLLSLSVGGVEGRGGKFRWKMVGNIGKLCDCCTQGRNVV